MPSSDGISIGGGFYIIMLNNFFAKKLIKSQMKGVSDEQLDSILNLVQKNPELFQKIATEIQSEMTNGKDQMTASMEVMKRYENELQDLSKGDI
jgi:esterase/lipase